MQSYRMLFRACVSARRPTVAITNGTPTLALAARYTQVCRQRGSWCAVGLDQRILCTRSRRRSPRCRLIGPGSQTTWSKTS